VTQYSEIPAVELARETMLGDLMSLVIEELKAAPDVWQRLAEHKQDAVIGRVHQRVGEAVRQAVELIAANGRTAIPATLEQVTVKDAIKGVVTVSKADPSRYDLTDAVGRAVMIVVADPTEFSGGAGDVKAEPDQRDAFDDRHVVDAEFEQIGYEEE